jgi:putative ABC transport system permease protein
MARVSPGFRTENLVLAEIALSHGKYTEWQKVEAVQRQMLVNIRDLPGVSAAHLAYDHPLDTNWLTGFSLADQPNLATDSVQLRIVTPGYFGGLGQPLAAGREFDERETPLRPGVAIINESFVRRYFPDGRAVGKTLLSDAASYGWRGQMPNRFEVIGVARDVRTPGLETKTEPFLYLSAWQFPQREMTVLVRTTNDAATTTSLLRQAVRELDSELPITRIRTMDRIISQTIAQPRLNAVLMSTFSALGLLLALVGVYGLVSYWVAACIKEIAIRVALGASRADVFVLVLRRGAVLIAPGMALGVAGALALSQFLRAQLFEISALDPLTYVAVPAAIAIVGLAACVVPARSAMRADPVTALRGE